MYVQIIQKTGHTTYASLFRTGAQAAPQETAIERELLAASEKKSKRP